MLEDVRQVKQVMGRLTGRVQRIKTELEEVRGIEPAVVVDGWGQPGQRCVVAVDSLFAACAPWAQQWVPCLLCPA